MALPLGLNSVQIVVILLVFLSSKEGQSAESGCGAYWAKNFARYCWKNCPGTTGLWCYTWKGCGWDEYCQASWDCHSGIACEGQNGCVQSCPIPETEQQKSWKKPNRAADISTEAIPGTNLMTGTFYTIENRCGLLTNSEWNLVECTHAEIFKSGSKKTWAEWLIIPSEEPGYYVFVTKVNKMDWLYYNKNSQMMPGAYNENQFQPFGSSRKLALWKFEKASNEDSAVHAIQSFGFTDVLIAHWENAEGHGQRNVARLSSVGSTNPAAQWTFTPAGVNLESRLFELNFKQSIADVLSRNSQPQIFQRKTALNPTAIEETTTFTEEITTNSRLELIFGQKLGLVHTVSIDVSVIPGVLSGSMSSSLSAEVSAGQVIEKSESKKSTFSRQVTIKPYSCTEMTYTRQLVNNAKVDVTAKLAVSGKTEGMTYGGLLRESASKMPGTVLRSYVEVTGFQGKFIEAKNLEAIYEVSGTMTADLAINEEFIAKELPGDKCNTTPTG